MAKCAVCGALHRACGPRTTVVPIDSNITRSSGGDMGLQSYDVVTDGRHPHKTTLMLSDEDAKRMGVFDQKSKNAESKPAAKKTAAAKTAAPRKARTPRNKAAKPAADKAAQTPAATPPAGGVEDASDPDASEA